MSTISSLSNLKGRRALITGATGQLGRIFANTLAELGSDLLLVDLESIKLKELSFELQSNWGVSTDYRNCNLELQVERTRLINEIRGSGIEINIVVNNAAFVGASDLEGWNMPFGMQSIETWRRAIEVNLTAVFDLCQGLFPTLKKAAGASIINITSIYGSYGPDWRIYENTKMSNPAAYATSKGGLTQLTRWLSTTMAHEVRVNAISPGGIYQQQDSIFVAKYESRTPLARMAIPDDLKGAMAFLATDLSQYVTGHILEVNGGWGVW